MVKLISIHLLSLNCPFAVITALSCPRCVSMSFAYLYFDIFFHSSMQISFNSAKSDGGFYSVRVCVEIRLNARFEIACWNYSGVKA